MAECQSLSALWLVIAPDTVVAERMCSRVPLPRVPDKGSVTRRGFAVLRVAIYEEPWVFAFSVTCARSGSSVAGSARA